MPVFDYRELTELAVAIGARRPIWRGDEAVAQCWRDRAEWLIKLRWEGDGSLDSAIAECDRYSGQ